jgi:hypothetical protein
VANCFGAAKEWTLQITTVGGAARTKLQAKPTYKTNYLLDAKAHAEQRLSHVHVTQ